LPISKLSLYGNINIGVYIFANNRIAFIPKNTDSKIIDIITKTLNVDVFSISIADLSIIGVMIAGNDNGIILPKIVKDSELSEIKRILKKYDVNLLVLESKYTALGNLILTNNKGTVIYPEFEKEVINTIRDTLGVENIEQRYIAGIPVVGSIGVVTDNGGIIHPGASDTELQSLEEVFKVPLTTGTVNFGVVFVRSGLVANNHGILVGENTTGPELMRIQEAFGVE